jgi:hypothetical protein
MERSLAQAAYEAHHAFEEIVNPGSVTPWLQAPEGERLKWERAVVAVLRQLRVLAGGDLAAALCAVRDP